MNIINSNEIILQPLPPHYPLTPPPTTSPPTKHSSRVSLETFPHYSSEFGTLWFIALPRLLGYACL